jgi:hypothetical protein
MFINHYATQGHLMMDLVENYLQYSSNRPILLKSSLTGGKSFSLPIALQGPELYSGIKQSERHIRTHWCLVGTRYCLATVDHQGI